jgi:hypothetical protein
MIKYNIKTVNDWLYNSNPIKGMYYNGRRVYRRFVANGQPTPPTPPAFEGKWKATYQDGHVESAQCDSSSEIYEGVINLTNLVSVEIGDCVRYITNGAFWNCTSLTACNISSGVTVINFNAFENCTSLQHINFPNSIESIGPNTFTNCSSLTSINIPDSVTSIGGGAFNNCNRLTSITVNSIVPPALGSRAFDHTNDCPIYVLSGSVETYKNAWAEYASRIQPIS